LYGATLQRLYFVERIFQWRKWGKAKCNSSIEISRVTQRISDPKLNSMGVLVFVLAERHSHRKQGMITGKEKTHLHLWQGETKTTSLPIEI
jgi:hypothetical protein